MASTKAIPLEGSDRDDIETLDSVANIEIDSNSEDPNVEDMDTCEGEGSPSGVSEVLEAAPRINWCYVECLHALLACIWASQQGQTTKEHLLALSNRAYTKRVCQIYI